MRFYKSSDTAYRAAKQRGEVGLTGSGQTCGPEYFDGYGWTYKTWDDRYLVPGGELSREFLEEKF